MNYRSVLTILVFFSAIALTGCGGNSPLQGTVTFEDGSPLTVGTVNFVSDHALSRGEIRSDGTYRVGSLKETDGLPRGSYRVYITGAVEPMQAGRELGRDSMGNPIQGMPSVRSLINARYVTAETTPLVCEIPASGNRFDIVVTPP